MTYRLLPDRRRAPRLALAGLCVFAIGVVWALVVGSMKSSFDSAERGMSKWFYDVGTHEPIHSIMYWVSWIGAGARTVPIVLTVAVALLLFGKWRWTLFLLLSSQAGFLISNTIKHVVGRTRPPWTSLSADQIGTSFPSGHTYAGVTGWVAMGLIVLYLFPKPFSTVLGWILIAIGLVNGPSRFLLGKHWTSDVLGAWLLASGWLLLCWSAFLWFWAPRSDHPDEVEAPTPISDR
jgi:membrane-associated phospholipid phosphatase